jgi:hypothetical protein
MNFKVASEEVDWIKVTQHKIQYLFGGKYKQLSGCIKYLKQLSNWQLFKCIIVITEVSKRIGL